MELAKDYKPTYSASEMPINLGCWKIRVGKY
jgi:hypothetical protein